MPITAEQKTIATIPRPLLEIGWLAMAALPVEDVVAEEEVLVPVPVEPPPVVVAEAEAVALLLVGWQNTPWGLLLLLIRQLRRSPKSWF